MTHFAIDESDVLTLGQKPPHPLCTWDTQRAEETNYVRDKRQKI